MISINKTMLAGNVGKLFSRETKAGPVVNLSIATTKNVKTGEGVYEKKTTWHNLVLFGRLAETAIKFDGQMKEIYIEGETQDASYTDKEGKQVNKSEVIVNQLQIISFKDVKSGDKKSSSKDDAIDF